MKDMFGAPKWFYFEKITKTKYLILIKQAIEKNACFYIINFIESMIYKTIYTRLTIKGFTPDWKSKAF